MTHIHPFPTQEAHFVILGRKNFILFWEYLCSAYYMKMNTFILRNNPMR